MILRIYKELFLKFVLAVSAILYGTAAGAQVPTVQDCLGAIPICQNVYSTTTSYFGMGNYPNEIPWGGCLSLGGETNSVWYTFTVQTSGNFSFVLTPNSSSDDYDWALFNLTNASCSDLYNNFYSLMVSCNSSGNTGPTGISTGNGGVGNTNGPGAGTNTFNANLPVVAGQTYVLMVSNWSNGTPGYNINFGLSTATIFDNIPPQISSIVSNIACGATTITFNFSENILCSTIAPCDLSLTGPGGPYTITNVYGAGCAAGGNEEHTFTITFNPPITAGGSFNLSLVPTVCGSVTDLCGNIGLAGSLPFTINLPAPNAGPNQSVCAGSSVTLSGSGCSNCTYTWNNGIVNGIPFVPTSTGTYTVTGTNPQGCSGTDNVVVTVNPPPPASAGPDQTICTGGSVTLNGSGGTTYAWNNGVQNGIPFSPVSTNTYTVTATDINGCSATSSVVVTVSTATMSITFNTNDEHCNSGDGSATVNVTGSSGNLSYTWSTSVPQHTQTASNLSAGNYTVTVTSNGCTATASVTINNLPGPSVNITGTVDETCSLGNGSATCTASGGSGTYTYAWSCSPPQFSATMNNVHAGHYTVTVSDGSCSATAGVIISNTPPPDLQFTSIPAGCGQANGSVTVIPSGGSNSYNYLWNNGQTTSSIINIPAGIYYVTVDDGQCVVSSSVVLIDFPGPIAMFDARPEVLTLMDGPVTFYDNSVGDIVVWQWNFGDGSPDAGNKVSSHQYSALGEFTVTLIVTDISGCMDTVSKVILIRELFTMYIPKAFTPDHNGLNEDWGPVFTGICTNDYSCLIYDRWGNLVFSTNDPYARWNGTLNNRGSFKDDVTGIYVYLITLKEISGLHHQYSGTITLLN